jgi:hypothetical protein
VPAVSREGGPAARDGQVAVAHGGEAVVARSS